MYFRKYFLMLTLVFASVAINSCDAKLIGLTLKPTTFDFGEVDRTLGKTQLFKLTNQTNLYVDVYSIEITGANAEDFTISSGLPAPYKMNPVETRTYYIIFSPKTAGIKTAAITVESPLEQSRIVTATLVGIAYSADVTPTEHDFGAVDLGDKTHKVFTFINNTNRDINVTSLDIIENGAPSTNFKVSNGTPGIVGAETGSMNIEIEFEPQNYGSKDAYLSVKTNDVTFTELKCDLSGFGQLILYEEFDNRAMCDITNTSAEWGTVTAGKLIPIGTNSFGSGSDGIYNPTINTTLDADNGPYEFSEIYIPSGVTVTVTGSQALEVFCQGEVRIEGELNLDGQNGQNAGVGGAGGPGGYAGGDGGTVDTGDPGNGPGYGDAGIERSGGGAGHAVKGQDGFSGGWVGATGGSPYGAPDLTNIEGGSGGGGGAVDPNVYHANYTGGGPGGGGGGGGGAMLLTAGSFVEIRGLISANGGNGGGHVKPAGSTSMCFGGGGGSGGAIKIISGTDIIFDGGVISVLGGWGGDGMVYANTTRNRGGYGSSGRIRLEDPDGIIDGVGGSVYPAPSCQIVNSRFVGGTGVDGVFHPQTNIKLNTNNGPFNYTSVIIPIGVTVTAEGNNPLEIYCTGDIEISGIIDVSGDDAVYQTGATGKLGGYSGGNGGPGMTDGSNGLGTGGGHGGFGGSGYGGASGGGFGTVGQRGSRSSLYAGGIAYGDPSLSTLLGGSGGGGGGGDYSDPTYAGGGGGAGGGALRLQAGGTISILFNGEVHANGGRGGNYGGMYALPGAGGSGGGILIQGERLIIEGKISARGGPGGDVAGVTGGYTVQGDEPPNFTASWGGEGRIRLEVKSGSLGGMLTTTQGKYSSPAPPGINPVFEGTYSVAAAILNAGLIGQSLWYDSTIDDPIWQDAILTGTDTNKIRVMYEGAEDDGTGQPDINTLTGWKENPSEIGNPRFMRFKIVFIVGINLPELDKIELPFTD